MWAQKRLFGLIWKQMSTNLNPSNLPQCTVLDKSWEILLSLSSPLSLSVRLFPVSLLRTLSRAMWHTQSLILKHQAEFTASFQVPLQVFSSLSSAFLSSLSSLSLLKKKTQNKTKKDMWEMNSFYGRLSSLLLKCAPSGRPSGLARVGTSHALLNMLWPFVCHFWQCCHWLWNPEESVWPSYISISLLLDYHRFSWLLCALLY